MNKKALRQSKKESGSTTNDKPDPRWIVNVTLLTGKEDSNLKKDRAYPRTVSTLGAGVDVSLSLLQLLDMLSCPVVGEAEILHLARTIPQRRELEALVNLWRSLGRPTSIFWRETRVFYNRIVDSYEKPKTPSP